MSKKTAELQQRETPWEVKFPEGYGPFETFVINGPVEMTWFAKWLVEAYNRDQPKREDYK